MGGKSHGLCGVLCFLGLTQISLIFFVGGKSHGLCGGFVFSWAHTDLTHGFFLWVGNLTDCVGFVFFRAHTDIVALTDFFD